MPRLRTLNRSVAVLLHPRDDCEPRDPLNTLTDRLNVLLNSSGPGYTLPLCPGVEYFIQAPILFAAPDQEISTVGYPTGDERATLVVAGPVANGQGHTTAVDGTCSNCSGVKLRYVQASTLLIFCIPVAAAWVGFYANVLSEKSFWPLLRSIFRPQLCSPRKRRSMEPVRAQPPPRAARTSRWGVQTLTS